MLTSLTSLAVPILLSAVALFVASFLSWMVVQLHRDDWKKLENEDAVMATAAKVPVGNYMFPCAKSMEEMKSEEFQKKYDSGPRGILTILPKANMGLNLGLTFLYFIAISFLLAYLSSMVLPPGTEFAKVLRFVSTAALMTFLAAMVQHAIWFKTRIFGHLIESIAFALIVGAFFAMFWPSA